jgi:hypothetical protein
MFGCTPLRFQILNTMDCCRTKHSVFVGPGHLDHTSLIDWYLAEIEGLMQEKEYYCGVREKFTQHLE